MAVGVSNTQSGLRAELVFHRQTSLLHVWTPEIRREDDDRRRSACTGRKRSQAFGIGHQGTRIVKRRSGCDQKWPGYSVRGEGLGNVEQILLDVKQAERTAHDCIPFTVERISKTHPWGNIVLAVGDVASEGERGITLFGLRNHLQIVAQPVVQR